MEDMSPSHQDTKSPNLRVKMIEKKEIQKGHKKLFVWQKANELAYQTYLASKAFSREEMFGIASQLRRAAISIPANIVEGAGRQNKKELKYFLNIALGSMSEVEFLLEFALRLRYLGQEKHSKLESLRHEVGSLLWRFYKSCDR